MDEDFQELISDLKSANKMLNQLIDLSVNNISLLQSQKLPINSGRDEFVKILLNHADMLKEFSEYIKENI